VENLFETIQGFCPSVIPVGLKAVRPGFQLSLLLLPGSLLIGIDLEIQRTVVWSGRKEAAVTAADLIKIITPKEPIL